MFHTRTYSSFLLASMLLLSIKALAQKVDDAAEDAQQKKALQSELLIRQTENKAINALQSLLKKRKGSSDESTLMFRLAELHMRRARSGRFFDLHRESNTVLKFAPQVAKEESAKKSLNQAIQIYSEIEERFPKFQEMDAVLFNNAFANQQLSRINMADQLYTTLIEKYPKSALIPDTLLSLGELKYDRLQFDQALKYLEKLDNYPDSKVYSYGVYKSAWAYYNLRKTDPALDRLLKVIQYHSPENTSKHKDAHNLRQEAFRDMALFYGETKSAQDAYSFFRKISDDEELATAMLNLGNLFLSHSRFKEMNIFLNEYLEKQAQGSAVVKIHLLLLEANESLKQRPIVIEHLQKLSELCKSDSVWLSMNKTATAIDDCKKSFHSASLELVRKWWEIYQKNKQHQEFTNWTRQAFQYYLDFEDPAKPDTKSRYAYAELLFQTENFREASAQYSKVGSLTDDPQMKHDADYAALVSLDKAVKKEKLPTDDNLVLNVAQNYVRQHPQGMFALAVRFKIATLLYDKGEDRESEKILLALLKEKLPSDLQDKSQDVLLDIYNLRKDLKKFQDAIQSFLPQISNNERKEKMTKLRDEARFAEIQEHLKQVDKMSAAKELIQYANDFPNSHLALASWEQALSLYFTYDKSLATATVAREFSQKFPKNKNSIQALKDAIQIYTQAGLLIQAAQTLEELAVLDAKERKNHLELASEFYYLEGKLTESHKLIESIMDPKQSSEKIKYLSKMLSQLKNKEETKEYQKIESQLIQLGVEPFASRVHIKKLRQLFQEKKYSQVFDVSRKIVGNKDIPLELRAEARFIQAKVLTEEFMQQSVKAKLDRLSAVLNIKTEKLEKAQVALLQSSQWAQQPELQVQVLETLSKAYKHYVDSISNLPLPAELSEDDKKTLTNELQRVVGPVLDKQIEIEKKLLQLAKEEKATSKIENTYADLPASQIPKVQMNLPAKEFFQPFLISAFKKSDEVFERTEKSTTSCQKDISSSEIKPWLDAFNSCLLSNKDAIATDLAMQFSQKFPDSFLGPYFQSLVAERTQLYDKSRWMVELALKKSPELPILFYQKARLLLQDGLKIESSKLMMKSYDLGQKSTEIKAHHAVLSFHQGNCLGVIEDLEKMDSNLRQAYDLDPGYSECLRQSGKTDAAIRNLERSDFQKLTDEKKLDIVLQIAGILETSSTKIEKTLLKYEEALKYSKSDDQKEWIQRKIQYLKNKSTSR